VAPDVWAACGFEERTLPEDIATQALSRIDWRRWRQASETLLAGSAADQQMGALMQALADAPLFEPVLGVFCTATGQPRKRLGTQAVDPVTRAWLVEQQEHICRAYEVIKAARVALESEYALTLAVAYASLYEAAKTARGGLDFGDLIARVHELLTGRADAAWVLYKLDGGIDHILLDEAQDTAPDQWDILRTLTTEFFAGEARPNASAPPSRSATRNSRSIPSRARLRSGSPRWLPSIAPWSRARADVSRKCRCWRVIARRRKC
jgi:ATP-dependent helicase/nuclease subunit A